MRMLHVTPAVTAFVLTGLLLHPAPAAAQRTETERVSRTIPLPPGGTLKLKSFSGKVTIVGTDSSEVSIEAVRRATRDRLDRIKLDIQSSGSTVTIEANKREGGWMDSYKGKNNVVETDFDIKVPSRTNVMVSVFSSPVTVTNVSGRHEVLAFSSGLRLSDISGRLRAHTFSGDVRVQLAASENQPELDLDTFSGDIEVTVPENVGAGVAFNSFSGNLRSDLPLTLKSSSRRNIRATLNGREGSTVKFKTFSGDVTINKR
jgi:DUF4097 and DUF4098 domain-containing protein YvlB